jgi:hypothetical protein
LAYCPKYEALDNERLLLNMPALMKAAVKKGLVEFAGNRVNYLVNNIMSPHFNHTWLKLKVQ